MQERLCGSARKARNSKHHLNPSALAGKIVDDAGERLTPSHTRKRDRRYRYYISQKLVTGVTRADEKQRTWRIPAEQLEGAIEGAVQRRVTELITATHSQEFPGIETPVPEAKESLDLVRCVRVAPGQLTVDLDAARLQALTGAAPVCGPEELTIELPFTERRRGVEMKMVVSNGAQHVDQKLLDNVILANHFYRRLKEGVSYEAIASEAKTSKRRVQQIIDLAFLAPDIVRDISNGTQPLGLTSDWCLRHELPADWQAQRQRIAAL